MPSADGEIVIAALRFNNIVLMVQPPRGFGEKPVAIYHDPVHRLRKGLTYGARRNCHVQVRVNYLDVVEGPIHGEGRPVRVSAVEDPEKCTELGVG